jgi:hypothetical protein
MVIPFIAALTIFDRMESLYPLLIAFPIYVGLCTAIWFLDRVKVIGNRNSRYCPACRYDLSGTFGAGIMRCPECGRDVSAEYWAVERPVA